MKLEAREYEKAKYILRFVRSTARTIKLRIETGQYEQAKDLLMRIITENPDNSDFTPYMQRHTKQNKNEDAIELLNKALHINPVTT